MKTIHNTTETSPAETGQWQ